MTSHEGFVPQGMERICGRGINYRISTRFVRIGMNAEMIANCLRARIWYTPKSCLGSIPIRQADTRTREPMQSSRRAGPGSRETQGLARRSDGSNRTLALGSGSSRCGQASKGVGGCLGVIRKVSVEGCEMPGEAAERASIPGYSRKPRELKHLSTWWKRNQQRLPQ